MTFSKLKYPNSPIFKGVNEIYELCFYLRTKTTGQKGGSHAQVLDLFINLDIMVVCYPSFNNHSTEASAFWTIDSSSNTIDSLTLLKRFFATSIL